MGFLSNKQSMITQLKRNVVAFYAFGSIRVVLIAILLSNQTTRVFFCCCLCCSIKAIQNRNRKFRKEMKKKRFYISTHAGCDPVQLHFSVLNSTHFQRTQSNFLVPMLLKLAQHSVSFSFSLCSAVF